MGSSGLSDEKKFNLDGPDGFSMYWDDLRKEEKYFTTRQNGGRGFMLWGAMSWYGLSSLVVVNGSINSEQYCSILEAGLLPFVEEFAPQDWVFQKDNATAHTARDTHTFFF